MRSMNYYIKIQRIQFGRTAKGGDPYVFGRGGEEALYLRKKKIDIEVVPGVSSVVAALADAGIPITHRGIAKGFRSLQLTAKR